MNVTKKQCKSVTYWGLRLGEVPSTVLKGHRKCHSRICKWVFFAHIMKGLKSQRGDSEATDVITAPIKGRLERCEALGER